MGLFGPSKKERMLQEEVERLNELLLPEHREIESLTRKIEKSKETISDLENTISNINSAN